MRVRESWTGAELAVRVPRRTRCVYGASFYPGWTVTCDGRGVRCAPSREGLVAFAAPAGTTRIAVRFGETLLRKAADAISLLSAILALTGWLALAVTSRNRPRCMVRA